MNNIASRAISEITKKVPHLNQKSQKKERLEKLPNKTTRSVLKVFFGGDEMGEASVVWTGRRNC